MCVCVGFTMNLLRKNHCLYKLKTPPCCSEEHSDKMNTLDFQRSYNLCLRAFYPDCFAGEPVTIDTLTGCRGVLVRRKTRSISSQEVKRH